MAENFLTQDEVDALLNHDSINQNGHNANASDNPRDAAGVRPYNMATQERIVRGRMPTFEIINARFSRFLQMGLYNLLRRPVDISTGPVKTVKYAEFIRSLVVPTNLNMITMKPLRGNALMVFDLDVSLLESMTTGIVLADALATAPRQLAGQVRGRVVVDVNR